ncbi:MAG: peptidoglycan-associated lipoprotein Pal [Burkholderiales bacterium]|nr:peptidoglycan-associated lipoprotein Pal [Burkholderiales bacterium]OJX07477.1 MAG: peptidoglycan-associated lipoprotein [Burkholderiales bacterium 70-64]
MRLSIRFLLMAVMASFLVACGSSVKLEDEAGKGPAPIESRNGAATSGAAAGATSERGVAEVQAGATDELNNPNSPLAKRSIYFDFDSFVVKDEFRPVIEAHARYLVSHKDRRVALQGNTDERGSREYNLALGQKRAEAVRRSLSALGVAEAQMEAVSFGEERPRATGQDEASYAENRRVDVVYQ